MSLIATIFLGLIVGLVARLLLPGRQNIGFFMTILLGIGGAMLATYGGQFLGLYHSGETAGFIGAVLGALVILFAFSRLGQK